MISKNTQEKCRVFSKHCKLQVDFFFFFSFTATKARVCSIRYRRYSRYPHGCSTELTEVSGTGIDVVPKLPKYPVPVLMLYRNGRSVRYQYESLYRYRRYRYPCRTELTEVSGTGIDVAPNLLKGPVPVIPPVCLGTYRTDHTLEFLRLRRLRPGTPPR